LNEFPKSYYNLSDGIDWDAKTQKSEAQTEAKEKGEIYTQTC